MRPSRLNPLQRVTAAEISLGHVSSARPVVTTLGVMIATMVVIGVSSSPAVAVAPAPRWSITSIPEPTTFSASQNNECESELSSGHRCDEYRIVVRNVGAGASSGTVTVSDNVAAEGLKVERVAGEVLQEGAGRVVSEGAPEEGLTCEPTPVPTCTYTNAVEPGGVLTLMVDVVAKTESPGSVLNSATVEGGEAPTAVTSTTTTVNGAQPGFALDGFGVDVHSADGTADSQAGDHPYDVTASFVVPSRLEKGFQVETWKSLPVQEVKDVAVELPPGMIGDPQATPQCPLADLINSEFSSSCPAASRIGSVTFEQEGTVFVSGMRFGLVGPIYNMVPEHGYPAEFAFSVLGRPIVMYANVVKKGSGYGVRVLAPGVVGIGLSGVTLTFFGDPGREDGGSTSPSAFLTNPVDCGAALGDREARVEADSWAEPGHWVTASSTVYPQLTGCNMLQFQPTITVQPERTQAEEPSGYEVALDVPQAPSFSPILATPELKNATVTLPEGVSVSPSAANGLVGCGETGPEGIDIPSGTLHPNEAGEGEALGPDGFTHATPGHCPQASTLGSVQITTPLLASPLHGHVYLAQPHCGGEGQPACTEASATNGELFDLYLEAEGSGVNIKLKGKVEADPQTGRLTARFEENPQLPFSELKLELTGGPRAPLANPPGCGSATSTSELVPWSAPDTPNAMPTSSFDVDWDGNGGACPASLPFAPSFTAGTVNPAAAGFSPFTLTLSRHDREQDLSAITVRMPPGLLGMLSQVQLCPEPQASNGTCGPQSLIGHTAVAAGDGEDPFWESGSVFLTESYKGEPFGLSIVVPAKAGPFNLGNVIVRASLHVDPHTSALTVTSDPLPRIIDGVPLRIQTVNVSIDKAGFIFNPTNCSQQQISGTVTGALPDGSPGSSVGVSSPFAVAGCKNLPFKPKFTALTQAKTSKAAGAYLHVKVTSGPGQANIAKVKVDLPKQLPSRLTTLQKACPTAVFEANPATCAAGSVVGTATAVTPVLKGVLTGPAYLVSHGGAAFPDLVIVLQGEGITLDLVGNTDIKKGITSSTFKSVPDAPITTFDLVLPEGPHSVLAANGNLCKTTKTVTVTKRVSHRVHGRVVHVLKKVKKSVAEPLVMPTRITGQNGAVLQQTTKVAVTGCAKAKARKAGKHKKGKRKSKSRKR